MTLDLTYANLNALITALSPTSIVYALRPALSGTARVGTVGLLFAAAESVVAETDVAESTFTTDHAAAVKVAHVSGGQYSALLNAMTTSIAGFKIAAQYQGAGAPSATTLATGNYVQGDTYLDTTNELLYVCTDAGTKSTSTWDRIALYAEVLLASSASSVGGQATPTVYAADYGGSVAPTDANLASGTYKAGDIFVDTHVGSPKAYVAVVGGTVVNGSSLGTLTFLAI